MFLGGPLGIAEAAQAVLVVPMVTDCEYMFPHAIEIPENPFDSIPVHPCRVLHELGQEHYSKSNVRADAQCCIHEQANCLAVQDIAHVFILVGCGWALGGHELMVRVKWGGY